MRICLLTRDPGHPLLAATAALLAPRHTVETLDPETAGHPAADALADVYLLKARTPRALALARHLESRGAAVVNSAAATALCQDRTAMADLARRAGLPFAATRTAADLTALGDPEYPFVVKSRHSRRNDLVALVDHPDRLRALAERWPGEPVVTQPYVPSTGWDRKIWVVDGQVFTTLRRSELSPDAPEPTPTPTPGPGPGTGADPDRGDGPADAHARLALRVGEVFGLDVYGVDLLDRPGEPVIVDVNAFPGVRGQHGAPRALADLALRAGRRGTERDGPEPTAGAAAGPRAVGQREAARLPGR